MSVEFDPSQEFAESIDGLETVAVQKRESGVVITGVVALRREFVSSESEPSGGASVQTDAVWYLRLPAGEAQLELADVVVDAGGAQWTVLAIDQQPLLGRIKCETRELRVALGCDDYVDVQRAVWQDLGEGPVITSWSDVYTAMPVRIQPVETVVSDTSNAPTATERFAIILGEHFPVESDDRFVAADGSVYRLESIEQAARIDALPIAKVVRVST